MSSDDDSLSDLSRQALQPGLEVQGWFAEAKDGSDRVTVLIATAVLDHMLRDLIEATFRITLNSTEHKDLFSSPRAPLADLSAKINLATAMGLIDRTIAKDMHRIRNLRNAFAHAPRYLDFSHPRIAAVVDRLTGPRWVNPDMPGRKGDFFGRCIQLVIDLGNQQKRMALGAKLLNDAAPDTSRDTPPLAKSPARRSPRRNEHKPPDQPRSSPESPPKRSNRGASRPGKRARAAKKS